MAKKNLGKHIQKEKIRKWLLPTILVGLLVLAVINQMSKTQTYQVQVLFPNGESLIAEVADSPEEQLMAFYMAGMLSEGQGVLIMYEEAGKHGIWTRNIQSPIDIIWLGPMRQIVKIDKNISPCSDDPCEMVEPSQAVLFVLQTKAGVAKSLNLEEGMSLTFRHLGDGNQAEPS